MLIHVIKVVLNVVIVIVKIKAIFYFIKYLSFIIINSIMYTIKIYLYITQYIILNCDCM